MAEYAQVYEGEWVRPVHRGFREQCCDCGLIHVFDFRVVNGRQVEFMVRKVDRRATANVRRAWKKQTGRKK